MDLRAFWFLSILSFNSYVICKNEYGLSVFRFASHFSDYMVLQRKGISEDLPPVIWGFGELSQTVKLTLNNVTYQSKVVLGAKGEHVWVISLEPQQPGGPFVIEATSIINGTAVDINLIDVLFGDVWFCGGQSNMQFTVSQSFRADEEIANAVNYPNIRLFTTQRYESSTPMIEIPKENILQQWSIASKDSVGGPNWQYFSAVCWMFGRQLYDKFKVPIGLISSNYGGTPIEAWSSPDALRKCNISPKESDERNMIKDFPDDYFPGAPTDHSVLWNAMIMPFLNTTIRGAIWYQGEANAAAPDTYHCTFPAMVADWRAKWYEGSGKATAPVFPFGFVQLAPTGSNRTYIGGFPVIRWAQTANLGHVPNKYLPNTFFAVAMDLPDLSSPYSTIHPRDKTDVAKRLYLGALNIAYGVRLAWQGPLVLDGEAVVLKPLPTLWGLQIYYDRNTVGSGIGYRSRDGFEVLVVINGTTASEKWIPVQITFANYDNVGLLIDMNGYTEIKSFRYEWRTYPCGFMECAIYTKDTGLPGPPWNYYGVIREAT